MVGSLCTGSRGHRCIPCIFLDAILFPGIAVTATVLGALQGLLFYLAGSGRSKSEYDGFLWLGAFSGAFLGVLGFPPVFSRAGVIAARPTVAVFILAAIAGGVTAGLVSGHVLTTLLWGRSLNLGRGVVLGGLLVLAAIDYHFYWPATIEELPSRKSLSRTLRVSLLEVHGFHQWTGRLRVPRTLSPWHRWAVRPTQVGTDRWSAEGR